MNSEKIKKLKEVELKILLEFDRVCKELGLNYFLVGGTLLGAVRHKGFIPWDDDIDVGLMRADYDIFIQKAQSLLSSCYFLQTRKSDPEFVSNFAKLRDSRTTYWETSQKFKDINQGVFIDIFPIDYYPDHIGHVLFDIRNFLVKSRISHTFYYEPSDEKKSILSYFLKWLCYLLFPTISYAINYQEKLYKSTHQSRMAANLCGSWGKREIIPTECFEQTIKLEFEGHEFPALMEYDRYLTLIYGDYMKLPPKEKQIGHHYAEVIDLNTPYIEYRGQILREP